MYIQRENLMEHEQRILAFLTISLSRNSCKADSKTVMLALFEESPFCSSLQTKNFTLLLRKKVPHHQIMSL